MKNKKCCKQCRKLNFYDCYLCDRTGEYVDLDGYCKYYKRRIGKFWTYINSPF